MWRRRASLEEERSGVDEERNSAFVRRNKGERWNLTSQEKKLDSLPHESLGTTSVGTDVGLLSRMDSAMSI